MVCLALHELFEDVFAGCLDVAGGGLPLLTSTKALAGAGEVGSAPRPLVKLLHNKVIRMESNHMLFWERIIESSYGLR